MHYLKNFSKIIILDALTGSFLFSFKGGVLIMEQLSTSTPLQGQNYREFFFISELYTSLYSLQLNQFIFSRVFLFGFFLFCSSTFSVQLSFYLYRNNIISFNIDYLTKYRVYLSLPAFYFWRREIRYKPIVTLIYHCISFYTLLSYSLQLNPHSLPLFIFN